MKFAFQNRNREGKQNKGATTNKQTKQTETIHNSQFKQSKWWSLLWKQFPSRAPHSYTIHNSHKLTSSYIYMNAYKYKRVNAMNILSTNYPELGFVQLSLIVSLCVCVFLVSVNSKLNIETNWISLLTDSKI